MLLLRCVKSFNWFNKTKQNVLINLEHFATFIIDFFYFKTVCLG